MPSMESVAALLIVLYQFFFGWCGAEPVAGQAAPQAQAVATR